jgi:signal transduction histidine kinase
MQLDSAVNALAVYAPVVVMGRAERETGLKALIAAGVADYVPRSEGCMSDALDLLEHRLARRQRIAESVPSKAPVEEWSKDFAEVLRHELNNPLTGILGNAELLLARLNAQERNSTDSRWNIFTAIKMAAPPYRQVERKISAIEFQW